MKALVTGGAGFIGSHLVDALVERGDQVLVLDDLTTGKRANLRGAVGNGATLEVLDITDASSLLRTVQGFGPEVVFHLAAQIDVRKSMADPGFDARLNVLGTVNLLEVARRTAAERFVFASTGGAIYGEGADRTDELPFSEDARCEPFSIYGQSKLAAEGYVGLYRRIHGLGAASVRLGNVYGPRQDPALEAGVVAIFCRLAVDGGRPTIFGAGKQTRDYVHVSDIATGLLAAAGADSPGPFNLGTGTEATVLELAERIGLAAGREDFEPRFEAHRPGEVERTYLDPTRSAEQLGWRAGRDLGTGIAQTLAAER